VATSLAWLLLVFFLPLVGAVAYLVLGEKRLGHKYVDLQTWQQRPGKERFIENLARLASPLL
jgi:hypothetical protein